MTNKNSIMQLLTSAPSFGHVFKKKSDKAEPVSIDRTYPKILAVYPTGSRYICNPPVMDTDEDKIVLVDRMPDARFLEEEGWSLCGEKEYKASGEFQAFRKEEKNRIFTTSRWYYVNFCAATALARDMNLLEKKDRIALFQEICAGDGGPDCPLPNKGFL
jgi:hypothetical protein